LVLLLSLGRFASGGGALLLRLAMKAAEGARFLFLSVASVVVEEGGGRSARRAVPGNGQAGGGRG
jgi:hypothetical protein